MAESCCPLLPTQGLGRCQSPGKCGQHIQGDEIGFRTLGLYLITGPDHTQLETGKKQIQLWACR